MLFSSIIIQLIVIIKFVVNITVMDTKTITISLEKETISKLDDLRGMIPRSRLITKILINFLEENNDKNKIFML
jgi:hypothetical protein